MCLLCIECAYRLSYVPFVAYPPQAPAILYALLSEALYHLGIDNVE